MVAHARTLKFCVIASVLQTASISYNSAEGGGGACCCNSWPKRHTVACSDSSHLLSWRGSKRLLSFAARHSRSHIPGWDHLWRMWRSQLIGVAAAFLAPIPQHKQILRAEPRWVDGPTDIGEAGAMSRHTGGAVCVLYFNPMGEGGAAALSTVEFAGQALPQCEFLLASQDRDKECWGAFDALPEGQALPCVEVFDGAYEPGIVAAGDLIATLASLGYKPGWRCGADPGLRRLGSILQPRGRPLVAQRRIEERASTEDAAAIQPEAGAAPTSAADDAALHPGQRHGPGAAAGHGRRD